MNENPSGIPASRPTQTPEQKQERGFIDKAADVVDVLGKLVQTAALAKRAYEGTPLQMYGGSGRRMANDMNLAQILADRQRRNDKLIEEERERREEERTRREQIDLARDLYKDGKITPEIYAETVRKGRIPDLTKPIKPVEEIKPAEEQVIPSVEGFEVSPEETPVGFKDREVELNPFGKRMLDQILNRPR